MLIMKRIISVILCLCMIAGVCSIAFAAETEYSDYPVIIVPGYGASALFEYNDDGSIGEEVWGWNIFTDRLLEQLKEKFPEVLTGAAALTLGSAKLIGKALGKAAVDMLGKLAFSPNGESIYNVSCLPNNAENCRFDRVKEVFGTDLYSEKEIGRTIDDYIPETQIYNFFVDFRYGAIHNAEKLDEFIQDVKQYTGKDKVNLYSLSHGGQVTATYLSIYGDKGDVDNAVLTVPAIGGSYVAYDILSENISFNEEDLIMFIENALYLEEDYEWLLKAQPLGFVDDIIIEMMPYLRQVAGLWESLWDFLPYDSYTDCFDFIDTDACAGLIEKTSYFHENIMTNFGEALRKCRAYGVNVSIVAGTGHQTITGSRENSDAIIYTAGATGAKVAPLGKRFSNGYMCSGNNCTNKSHNHLSPSMEIDASYCYLPENTWFIEGMFHGMTFNEDYAEDLAIKLLLTDELKDVYTNEAFPQFKYSENMAYTVYGEFNNSVSGYITSDSTQYTVTNISEGHEIKILSVYAQGLDIAFDGDYNLSLAPGESAVFDISGDIPEVGAALASVTVTYKMSDSITPYNFRTFRYTVNNGESVKFDSENTYSDASFAPPINDYLSSFSVSILKKLGVYDWLRMWFDILQKLLGSFGITVSIQEKVC